MSLPLTCTTPASCMVMQFCGVFDSWKSALAVDRWTFSSLDLRYLTSGATASSSPNAFRFVPQLQQRAIASARCCRSLSSTCKKKQLQVKVQELTVSSVPISLEVNGWVAVSLWLVCNWVVLQCRLCLPSIRERNVLFNDTLNTIYLRLYGIGHMVKDHSDSERGNPLPPHGLLFPINSKGSFICTTPHTGLHIPQPLLHQSYSTGWNKK